MNASTLIVRDATPADLAFLLEANAAMALETESRRLDPAVLTRGIATVFEHAERGFYLVAEREGEHAGCLLVTFEWSDWRNGTWWWLQSVYVTPAARRGGVFRALHDEVARRAAADDALGLRLYVERDNRVAQQTYERLAMVDAHYTLFERLFERERS